MRIYIIGNDGITLCREPPAVVNEGELVVASKQELHAAALSGKRLLALWNALSDVEKRHTQVEYWLSGEVGERFWPQLQGQLYVP